jgi:hypothetical protein
VELTLQVSMMHLPIPKINKLPSYHTSLKMDQLVLVGNDFEDFLFL